METFQGSQVTFVPSESTKSKRMKGSSDEQKEFVAIVSQKNAGSVDLTILTNAEANPVIVVKNVRHVSEVEPSRSYWK